MKKNNWRFEALARGKIARQEQEGKMKGGAMYTKGPWIYDNMQDNYYGNVIRINGTVICRMINQGTMSVMEHNANAHLISACPDLLEACRAAFERLTDNDMMVLGSYGLTKQLEQAIAKAEGRD